MNIFKTFHNELSYKDVLQLDGAFSVCHINYDKSPIFNGIDSKDMAKKSRKNSLSYEDKIEDVVGCIYSFDGTEKKTEDSEEEKKEVYRKAEEILKLAREEDSDFEKLIMEYSEDERSVYSFGKGEMESSFEEASFNLETGQISDIVETSYGYHIIKCISTFNREETDANKVKIVEKRKEEVLGQEYEAFVTTLTRNINEELWESVSLIHDENVTTMDFFEIYNKYFEKDS